MSNVKIEEHQIETSGIYDLTEAKTQRQINADLKGSLNTLETYEAYRVTGTISSSSLSITKSGVTANMVPVACEFGTPANVLSNYTITTAANTVTFSGITLGGSTTVDIILIRAN